MNKKRVAIIFAGKSPEHEVAVRSAKNVTEALDKNKFEYILVGISKEGTWYQMNSLDVFNHQAIVDSKLPKDAVPVALISENNKPILFNLKTSEKTPIDVAFPVMHGSYGEDGCVQGLFKMVNVPFVGCGVLASAIGMDKEVMKRLLTLEGIPNAKYRVLTTHNKADFKSISQDLGLPFFIKPANAGSSVGVHKIKSEEEFELKLKDAFKYDFKVLAEEFVQGREIECSVMGPSHSPEASVCGEVIPTHEFYSYEAKYLDDNGAVLKIPAELDSKTLSRIQEVAKRTYQILGCDGLTRVDFFLKKSGEPFINEVNTIPGFTKISMYPKMWEASGVKYSDLISKLIQFSLDKYNAEQALETNFIK